MAEVDDLRPEDRIKKLKEKQAEMKKAIAEAQKKIAESETELNAENLIKEKIPIPQLKADSMSELSEAEKEIFKTKRLVSEDSEDTEETVEVSETEESLEEVVGTVETGELPPPEAQYGAPGELSGSGEYVQHLSQQPASGLYQSMAALTGQIAEQGYASAEQQRDMGSLYDAMWRKVQDMGTGSYAPEGTLADEVQEAFSAIQQMKSNLVSRDIIADSYKKGDSADTHYMRNYGF
ncbi:MAG TPA: hypothetical protein DHN29_20370 [Cytophagales bacterium]|nr:hypothetical protein [Cytophagales bacterium]|tara:strand:+ start:1610 stop:2317 length:708 start_codon:yes stop_codon:yes gene_type:complete